MGKPAARMGDSTAHGGAITLGCPTVLIGGMPAARMGDMHVCPMVTPGTPPIPHVGGPIILGSTGVLIGGAPAARMGDMVTCVGPPDTILMGCMTVLIGEAGGGGGGAGAGVGGAGGGGSISAATVALISAALATSENQQSDPVDSDDLDITITDNAKFPIVGVRYDLKKPDNSLMSSGFLSGHLRYNNVEKGTYTVDLCTVISCKWSAQFVKVGDSVDIDIKTAGIIDGTHAMILIFRHKSGSVDRVVKILQTQVSSDSVKASWVCTPQEESAGRVLSIEKTCAPFYYFVISVDKITERSEMLKVFDTIELCCTDEAGQPLKGVVYELTMESGEVKTGKLDDKGKALVENVVPGIIETRFEL